MNDPVALLQAARTEAASGDWPAAARRLRAALRQRPDYTFHVRAQGILQEIGVHAAPQRKLRIAVLGSATTSLLIPVLRALCFRDGFDVELYEGMFGAYRQEILTPDSGLYTFAPDVTFIIPTAHDLALPALGADADALIESVVTEHAGLWQDLTRRCRTHVVQHTYDIPVSDSVGTLAARHPGGRRQIIRRLNLALFHAAPPSVSVLDTEQVMAGVGHAAWHDAAMWHRARQYPAGRALPALAEEQAAHIRALTGLAKKVVVCDLDNTLWHGVIGEDGLHGIAVGDSSPAGEAHAALQRYLKELRARGVLLAVCSKNNPEDARLPFLEHRGMVLQLDDFAAFEANWDDKATNIRRIAETLSLGVDSFVLLDDNPSERAWIQEELPDVTVVDLGGSPSTYVRELDGGRYFEVLAVSAEDERRAELYRQEHHRQMVKAQSGSLTEFLAGLAMEADVAPITPGNLGRVTQLVNKTNQFNLTTRRYTEAQLAARAELPGSWSGVFTLADRFGDHGIVGVLLCVPDAAPDAWEIDTWLLSCRVLGRDLERFMLDRAVTAARDRGISRLVGVYRPTARNRLVADLFSRLGFVRSGETPAGDRYELAVATVMGPYCGFIRDKEAPRTAPAAR
jgi:FkbH-like protein